MGIVRLALPPLTLAVVLAAALTIAPARQAAATDLQGQLGLHPAAPFATQPRLFPKAQGQPVTLINIGTGALLARTLSDASGLYAFRGVALGSYKVVVGFPGVARELIVTVQDTIVQHLPAIVMSPAY